jgi:hypothetical protein
MGGRYSIPDVDMDAGPYARWDEGRIDVMRGVRCALSDDPFALHTALWRT